MIAWTNDIDKHAVETYEANYDTPIAYKDLYEMNLEEISNLYDTIGGFPSKPSSMIGASKGLDDRGTCFLE